MVQRLKNTSAQFELGYWGIRGLGQPIRCLLTYVEEPFSEVRVGVREDGELIRDRADEQLDWQAHKEEIDFAFTNLPYLIDTSGPVTVSLTQSNAILRHLGRRFDLYGDDDAQRAGIDMLQDEAYDFRNCIIETTYLDKAEYAVALSTFRSQAIPRYVDRFESWLQAKDDPRYFIGDRLSIVDFILYELLWQTSLMVDDSISQNRRSAIWIFLKSFEDIPQISTYMDDVNFIRNPINSPWAAFA